MLKNRMPTDAFILAAIDICDVRVRHSSSCSPGVSPFRDPCNVLAPGAEKRGAWAIFGPYRSIRSENRSPLRRAKLPAHGRSDSNHRQQTNRKETYELSLSSW
jgi:hypothetical protein